MRTHARASSTGSARRHAARSLRLFLGTAAAAALMLALAAAPAFAAAPVATIESAKNVEYRSADLEGTVTPNGFPTNWRFEYISEERFQENLAKSLPGFNEASVPLAGTVTSAETVGGHIEGLQAGTTYHLRLFAKNVTGSDTVEAPNFTTNTVSSPVVTEVEATEIDYATFTAKGKVEIAGSDPAFTANLCRFEVATQQQWEENGNAFPEGPFEHPSEEPVVRECDVQPSGPGTTAVQAKFKGEYSPYNPPPSYYQIPAGTTYHLRLVAQNQSGTPAMQESGSTFATKPVAKPALTGPTASSVTATSAHISATVAPNAPLPITEVVHAGYDVHWYITCTPDCGYGGAGEIQAGEPATEITSDLGLQPNLHYTVILHALNAGGEETAQTSLTTPPIAPEVTYPTVGAAVNRTATGARLIALLNPHNSPLTDCHFEYGLTTAYGQTAPCSSLPTGNGFSFVGADISGLQPATLYHLRLIAANATGPATGADRVFRTFSAATTPTCANEAVRVEQRAQYVPECRAWEMSSPLDKNGGNIVGEGPNVVAATDGSAVMFHSRSGFADDIGTGSVGMTQYIASRGGDGWGTHSISPTPAKDEVQTLFEGNMAGVFSEDLGQAVMWGYDLPGGPGGLPHETNIYHENTVTRQLSIVTQAAQMVGENNFPQYLNGYAVGASANLEVITFEARAQLLPAATPNMRNVYEWEDGVLRLGGILPDGTTPEGGSELPNATTGFAKYRDSVSADGSRVAFVSPKEGQEQIYLRRNHTSTAWVSEAEGTGVTAPEQVNLEWMSPDGKRLLFTSTSKLTSEDTDEWGDLYLYTDGPNPSSESNLKLISVATSTITYFGRGAVLGANDDASRIYYLSEDCHCGTRELNIWDHGTSKEIFGNISGNTGDWFATSYTGSTRVSQDASVLAFLSSEPITGDETNGHNQVYVYDAATESLTCASCMSSGATEAEVPEGMVPRATSAGFTHGVPQTRPRWLSADGTRVFFTTAAGLAPEDLNGLPDVYVYDTETGQQRLISSGKGEEGAWFEDASRSGDDVFFLTNRQLVGRDTDQLWDIYDARVEGGFPEPPPPPTSCSGDGCRGVLSSAAEVSSPATPYFSGPGNQHRKHKKHKKHKKHRHHHGKRHNGAGK